MEQLKAFQLILIAAALMVISVNSVNGQISTPCTISMIRSFTPCANLITGSTNNRPTLSSTCCDSLRSLMSTSTDCACMVISANVPFQLPVGRALALSLPQACNINDLPAQCQASRSPLPAPGPALLGPNGPTLPPAAASPLSPGASKAMGVGEERKLETVQLAQAQSPASAPAQVEVPTKTPGIRPVVMTPQASASNPSYVSLSPFVLVFIGIMVVTY